MKPRQIKGKPENELRLPTLSHIEVIMHEWKTTRQSIPMRPAETKEGDLSSQEASIKGSDVSVCCLRTSKSMAWLQIAPASLRVEVEGQRGGKPTRQELRAHFVEALAWVVAVESDVGVQAHSTTASNRWDLLLSQSAGVRLSIRDSHSRSGRKDHLSVCNRNLFLRGR